MAGGQGFSQSTSNFPLSIIPRKLRFRRHLHVTFTKTNERNLGTFRALSGIGEHWTEKDGHFFSLLQGVDFRVYIVAHNNYVWKGGYWRPPS
jgi:hypothetical protein